MYDLISLLLTVINLICLPKDLAIKLELKTFISPHSRVYNHPTNWACIPSVTQRWLHAFDVTWAQRKRLKNVKTLISREAETRAIFIYAFTRRFYAGLWWEVSIPFCHFVKADANLPLWEVKSYFRVSFQSLLVMFMISISWQGGPFKIPAR